MTAVPQEHRALSLYKIADEVQHALSLTNDDGSIPDDVGPALDALQMAFDQKAGAVVKFRQSLECTAMALETEIQRLQKWRDSVVRKAEWLKGYLKSCMEQSGIDRLETPVARLTLCKSPPSVQLESGAAVPEEFARTKTTVELDKVKALSAWKAGVELPPSITVKESRHLRIT